MISCISSSSSVNSSIRNWKLYHLTCTSRILDVTRPKKKYLKKILTPSQWPEKVNDPYLQILDSKLMDMSEMELCNIMPSWWTRM